MPEKTQKLFRAGRAPKEPRKKAIASVTDVIVMDGPARVMPCLNLLSADRCIGV